LLQFQKPAYTIVNDMANILNTIEIAVSVLLSLSILIQHRASGLSAVFGGSGAAVIQRRGAEKVLFQMTIWLGVIFLAIPVIQWFIV